MKRIYPLPEAIKEKEWNVREDGSAPRVNLLTGEMFVPLGSKEHERTLRNHEMAHIRYTPSNWADETKDSNASVETVQAVEDFRINYCAQHDALVNMSAGYGPLSTKTVEVLAEAEDIRQMVLASIAYGAIDVDREKCRVAFDTLLRDRDREVISAATNTISSARRIFATTIEVAEWLDSLYPPDGENNANDDSDGGTGGRGDVAASGVDGDALSMSGLLEIVRPDLVTLLNTKGNGKRIIASKMGAVLYRPSNLLSSGKVFRGVRRQLPGVTYLIDVSGSMSLTSEDVKGLILRSPAGVVATYSGNALKGELRIVAEKGRMCSEEDMTSLGGNVVDYPALLWLEKQKGKRIWICDGATTGIHDRSYPSITRACREVEMRGKIYRYESIDDFFCGREAGGI
jgi:hypothetical protein